MVSRLLEKLINTQSTQDKGELETAKVLDSFFKDHGIESRVDVWDNTRANITATVKGDGSKPAILFASHLDVVPAGDAKWKSPPFEATVKDGKIFGRGSCDMKAGNAAIAVAVAEIIKSGVKLKGDLVISSTAGEETDSCGAIKFVEQYKARIGHLAGIILPEPTDFNLITGHRGIFWLKITTRGKTAHGSMPHLGINAINSMTLLLIELQNYLPESENIPGFGKSSVSINCINGGKATNVIPDSCSIEIDIRTVPKQDTDKIIADIRKILDKIKDANPDFDGEVKIIRNAKSMFTDPECGFVQNIKTATAIEQTKIVGYTTDGPIFERLNAPVVVFGPGKTELAHQPDEYVDIKDLEKAVDMYKKIILQMLQ